MNVLEPLKGLAISFKFLGIKILNLKNYKHKINCWLQNPVH